MEYHNSRVYYQLRAPIIDQYGVIGWEDYSHQYATLEEAREWQRTFKIATEIFEIKIEERIVH